MSKVNLYISYDPADKKELDTLLEWLFPMQDEVNIWYQQPPTNIPHLALPWRILLFWYRAPNYMQAYYQVLERQRSRAHLYFFLASPKSIQNTAVQADIALANKRKTEGDWRSPRLFRLIARPCHWGQHNDWAGLASIMPNITLRRADRRDWMELTEAIDFHVKFIEPILKEARFYQGRPVVEDEINPYGTDDIPLPDLNDDPESVTFEMPDVHYPPAWAGWIIMVVLLLAGGRSLTSERERIGADLHLKARPAKEYPIEYPRENRYVPSKDTAVVFPPAY